jgi:phage/conjugal plasmid C-4 type zinc finger TraR family protein
MAGFAQQGRRSLSQPRATCTAVARGAIIHGSGLDDETRRTVASGWARDGAVQDQIDANVEDAVLRARSRLPHGESLRACAECEAPIPEARRIAIPGVRLCVACQSELDREQVDNPGYNRRGSKDSQLR